MTDVKAADPNAARFEAVVSKYVEIRDEIKARNDAHATAMTEITETQNLLTAWLTKHLEAVGAESVRTKAGTVYSSTRYSASLADPQAFMNYVKTTDNFDLLDRKANATAVREHVATQGGLPPGVNLNAIRTVGVRRAAGT
jgi:hypothetical protein